MSVTRPGSKPVLISFLFTLDTERGHVYEYNKATGEAARLAGWEHRAAVRAAARVADWPAGWEKCLGSASAQQPGRPLAKLIKGWQLTVSLAAYLRRQADATRPVILFLEWFEWVHLLPFALAIASLPRRKAFTIWLVHRIEGDQKGVVPVNHPLIRWLQALVKGRLAHFSDSEILVSELSRLVQPVFLLPIPHTAHFATEGAQTSDQSGLIVAWLPGRAIPEKGVGTIRGLTRMRASEAASLQVVISESSQFQAWPGGCQIRLLPDVLPRRDYITWMQRADLILLPYDPTLFRARTSGVFIEAIAAGKPTVVTDGTWMASELRKHDLEELILDWDSPGILSELIRVARDLKVAPKLARMQAAYAEYHSVPGYARVIQRVWEETGQ